MWAFNYDNLADHIAAALAPCQDEELLSRNATAEICRSEAGSLPDGMTSMFGFECRLGQEEPVGDFLVRIGAEPEEWRVLERYATKQDSEIWRRIAILLSDRAKSDSPLSTLLQNLWLEYDLVTPVNDVPAMSIFFGTDHLTRKAEAGWATELASALRGEPLSDAARHKFIELIAVLPESAKLFQVGIMCSRSGAPLRVCVIGQKLDEVSTFLAAARWPSDLSPVVETLRQFASVTDQVALDLDILDDGQLAPKLGVELYQKPSAGIGRRITELVTLLNNGSLCLPQKATGLLAWGGITHERRYRDLWPAALITRKALRGGNESSTFCRWLHHIKIVLEPNAPPVAKAYLAVSHAFLADSAIRESIAKSHAHELAT